jgi:hypothetical protein
MDMLQLSHRQRDLFAEKAIDLANIAAGALVFGQFLSEEGFRWSILAVGAMCYVFLIAFAYRFTRE